MEGFHGCVHLVKLGLARPFGHGRAFYGADEQVFRGVGQIDKFQQLRFVAHACQQIPANRIGGQRRHALLHDPVAGEEGKRVRLHLCV